MASPGELPTQLHSRFYKNVVFPAQVEYSYFLPILG